MRRARLVLLGARLALGGGREAWARTLLTAAGVAAGVALLLGAASIPRVVDGREGREAARDDLRFETIPRAPDTVLSADVTAALRGTPVYGRMLEPEGPAAPLPPGVARFPRPGEAVVSPALAERLRSGPDAGHLRRRLGARVVGTIGRTGLNGPGELAFYRGAADLDPAQERVTRLDAWGETQGRRGLPPILVLLLALAVVALVMPVAVFIATAVRFGGQSRDRRLAALRLVGADRSMTAHIAAGEALLGALGGLVAGGGLFALLRPLVDDVRLADLSVYAADVRPAPALAALIAVAVPSTAVAVTLLAMRGVAAEPLGVVRRATPARRRLGWRLVLPLAGVALLATMGDGIQEGRAAVGVALVLVGVAGFLPWLVERAVARLGPGPVPWQLAVRRLQVDGGTAARVVTGVAVAVAGAVALQMLLSGAERDGTRQVGTGFERFQAVVEGRGDLAPALTRVPGVERAVTLRRTEDRAVVVATCADLREVADLPRCADGDAFTAAAPDPGLERAPAAGARVEGWTVPAGLPAARPRRDWADERLGRGAVLATPGAVPASLLRATDTTSLLELRAGTDVEQLRTAALVADPFASAYATERVDETPELVVVRNAITAGAILVLVLIAASLLVDAAEQLRERRRLLAELMAFGVRRSTIAWSLLWQAAIPVTLGIGLAALVGIGLGAAMLRIADERVAVDLASILGLAGAGIAAVLLVTLASLPPLWRAMRASGLRTE